MILIRRISGQSMLPTLLPNQIVIFKRVFEFRVGQIVLAKANQLEIVKRVIRVSSNGVYLQGDAPHSLAYFVNLKDLKAVLLLKF